jgi:O-antigen ligase
MSIALIALFYELIKPKMYRLCALVLLSFNAGLLFLSSQSSLWVATLSLIVFLVFVLKKKFIKLLRSFVLMFLLLGLIIYCVSPEKAGSFYKRNIYRELKSIGLFSSYALQHKLVAKVSNVENAVEQINEYQRQMALLKAAVKADVDLKTPLPQVEALPSRGEESKAAVKANVDLNSLSLQYASLDESSRIENNLDNINWRLSIWKQTLRFGLGSPIIGRGFGAYPVYKIYASRQYPNGIYEDSRIVPVHNHIITVFLKMGVIGLGFFLFLNIYVFIYALAYLKKCNLKFMNNLLIALLGSLVFWHALAFFFDIIDSPPTSIWLWLLIGLIFATIEADKKLLNIKE